MIEGLHGVPFDGPLTRARETVEIVREDRALRRPLQIPLPGGGRTDAAVQLPEPGHPDLLRRAVVKMLELRIADGWLGTSFVPEAAPAFLDHLDAGLTAAGHTRADLDACQGAEVAFADDEQELAPMLAARRKGLAFSLGGMGTASANSYRRAYARQGWSEVAAEVASAGRPGTGTARPSSSPTKWCWPPR